MDNKIIRIYDTNNLYLDNVIFFNNNNDEVIEQDLAVIKFKTLNTTIMVQVKYSEHLSSQEWMFVSDVKDQIRLLDNSKLNNLMENIQSTEVQYDCVVKVNSV